MFKPDILFFQDILPSTALILNPGAPLEQRTKLSKDVLRSGVSGVAAKLCLEEPIWPPLPKEGSTQ